jgi:hypothetical protein
MSIRRDFNDLGHLSRFTGDFLPGELKIVSGKALALWFTHIF